MNKLIAATLFVVACGSHSTPATEPAPVVAQPTASEPAAPPPLPAPPQSATKARPEFGSYGFDAKGMDSKVTPGDSFYKFANGGWLASTPIPADKSNYGMFTVLSDKSDERTKDIIIH